jgi:hypothetical protein
MSDHDPKTRPSAPAPDPGDATPPHGDELRHESTFGRSDRYANQDDPESQPRIEGDAVLIPDEELEADDRRRRMRAFDDAAAEDARMEVRRREHSSE